LKHFSKKLIWIPSHIGITENENVDKTAKDVHMYPRVYCPNYNSNDISQNITKYVFSKQTELDINITPWYKRVLSNHIKFLLQHHITQ